MTYATKYLKGMLEAAYEPDFICDMDDLINADNMAEKILATTYKNADYRYLRIHASQLHVEARKELC